MSSTYGKHECVELQGGGYCCSVCGQTFRRWRETQQYCTGKGFYAQSSAVPDHLKTVGEWAKEDKRPKRGAKAKAWLFMYVYGRGHFWADLWSADQVVGIQRRKPKA
jgi:hypothetical protein